MPHLKLPAYGKKLLNARRAGSALVCFVLLATPILMRPNLLLAAGGVSRVARRHLEVAVEIVEREDLDGFGRGRRLRGILRNGGARGQCEQRQAHGPGTQIQWTHAHSLAFPNENGDASRRRHSELDVSPQNSMLIVAENVRGAPIWAKGGEPGAPPNWPAPITLPWLRPLG